MFRYSLTNTHTVENESILPESLASTDKVGTHQADQTTLFDD